ncbi:pyridoxamine 5'-phosphate oxidase [Fibrella aquatica]|jgi:pyridoxamine 5'-phosphate oxidase|uniref:pyridoxamine 5'-phosphate oxidase n=1 Tax=Fibrella aquatica TaxID=3242487 RepID=UPI003520A61B
MSTIIADLRKDYTLNGLDQTDVSSDPFAQFQEWFQAALAAGVHEPNAMHLSTISPQGRPEGRIVLIKGLDATGFTFYTNYTSQKAASLIANPFASLTFFWPELERQVRIEGRVEKVTAIESDTYFNSRPRGSQLGAWVSHQSEVISGRDVLESRQQTLETRFADQPIPRPDFWGGFRVIPSQLEFWQGRPSRLHDRIRYRFEAGSWLIERVSP